MKPLSLTTIILTYNEELHIERCLKNVSSISEKIYVVDSPLTDSTQKLCKQFDNVEVVEHKYAGCQAAQFNWFIDNHKIDSDWILRLDADEYLSMEVIKEIEETLPTLPSDVIALESDEVRI